MTTAKERSESAWDQEGVSSRFNREAPPWKPPLPLYNTAAPPPFPIREAFPPALDLLREFLEGLAHQLQVPVDLPAMLLLPVGAVSISQKFIVEVRDGFREVAALWTLSLLESGERKSAGFRRMTDPLVEWERDEAERLAPEIAAAAERLELLERERKNLRGKAGDGDAEAGQRAIELAKKISGIRPLVPPSLVVTDATSEAIVELMVSNGERALVASPEGDALDVLMGRYDDQGRPNLGIWLKGYSGDRLRVIRRGRPPEYLERPTLSVGLAVQPEAVRGMFASRVARGRGLLARFFPSAPQGRVGRREIGAPPVEERLEMAYVAKVRHLLGIPLDPEGGPRIVRLCPQALGMFTEFERYVEKQLARGGALGDEREWGAKLCGGIARISLVLHCLEHCGGLAGSAGGALDLSAVTMKAGLAWAPYLIEHEGIASGLAGCDPRAVVAERVLNWLERSHTDTFTRRDCFDACRGAFLKVVDDIDDGLRLLVELGYTRPLPTAEPGASGGRPPSAGYEVNPLWDRGAPR